MLIFIIYSCGAGVQACGCKRGRLWVRFSLDEMKYLIFSFPRSAIGAKRDVEFRYSTRNVSRIRRKVGNDSAGKKRR